MRLQGNYYFLVENVSSESVTVGLAVPTGNPEISRYEVHIQSEMGSCVIDNLGSNFTCQLSGLIPAKEYVIRARACLPNLSGCGDNVTGNVWTMPPGWF